MSLLSCCPGLECCSTVLAAMGGVCWQMLFTTASRNCIIKCSAKRCNEKRVESPPNAALLANVCSEGHVGHLPGARGQFVLLELSAGVSAGDRGAPRSCCCVMLDPVIGRSQPRNTCYVSPSLELDGDGSFDALIRLVEHPRCPHSAGYPAPAEHTRGGPGH